MKTLVLASSSPTRAQLLRSAGVAFDIVRPRVDEEEIKRQFPVGAPPAELAVALAECKAVPVARELANAMVLGADQLLVCRGAIFSKAPDLAALRQQLLDLRGSTHTLITAVALAENRSVVWRHVAEAQLTMRVFSEEFLDWYLGTEGEILLGSVGGYRLEALGAQWFESVSGDYFAILGLPLAPLLTALRDRGVLPA